MASGSIEKVSTTGGAGYVKLPDGTMIQWGEIYSPSIAANSSGTATITFPVPFADATYVLMTQVVKTSIPALRSACIADTGKTVSSASINLQNNYGAASSLTVWWSAYGRWK